MKKFAVLLTLALAACSSPGTGHRVAVGEPGSELEVQRDALDDLTADDIGARQATWADSEPEAYRYLIDSTCGCEWVGSFEVTVLSGEVVTVTSTDPSSEKYRDYFAQSVDEMFAMFQEASTVGAEEGTGARAAAQFDQDLGYPSAFMVRWTESGEPYSATISEFASIEASEVVVSDAGPVPLVITNQSFEHPDVRIAVTVDGEAVVEGVFEVRDQHSYTTYDLPLEPGRHELVATSDAGARLSQTVEVVADEPLFLVLTHWAAEEPGQEPFYFGFTESSQPPGFG